MASVLRLGTIYPNYINDLLATSPSQTSDLTVSGTLKCALVADSYTPSNTDHYFADIQTYAVSTTEIQQEGLVVGVCSMTITSGTYIQVLAPDVTFPQSSYDFRYVVFYDTTIASGTLVCFWDFGGSMNIILSQFVTHFEDYMALQFKAGIESS